MRVASWSALISRLKNATAAPTDCSGAMPSAMSRRRRSAALKAMLVASAVLPMPGRPATMTRSESCRPPIFSLIEVMPVVLPAIWPPELKARSIAVIATRVAMPKLCASLVPAAPSATW